MIWPIVYLSAVLLAQYTAIWFIPLPVFGLVSVGTLVFGATFTARDFVHKKGRLRVYEMIAIAVIAAIALSALGQVDWRIILASSIAIILSETADTEVYQRLLSRHFLIRITGSNSVSIPIDSVMFNVVAFLGVFSLPMLASIVFGEIVTKTITGGALAIWRYLI